MTMWRKVWLWIDHDFNDPRPWSMLIVGLVIFAVAGISQSLFDDINVSDRIAIFGGVALLGVVLPYYLYRQSRNLLRVTKRSIDELFGSRGKHDD